MNGSKILRRPHDGSGDDSATPVTKRRRVAIACQACRDRKSKCCGTTPKCSTCRQMDTECTYPAALSKTDALRQDVTSMVGGLEERMGRIERLLTSLESRQEATAPPTPASRPYPGGAEPTPSSVDGELEIGEDALQSTSLPDQSSDGVGIVPLYQRDDSAFFGPSSNIAFLRLVSRALAKNANSGETCRSMRPVDSHSRDHHDGRTQMVYSEFPGGNSRSQSYRIPPDKKARELLSGFFQNAGELHPYVHQARFLNTYYELRRSNFAQVRPSWLALLFIIFAVSSATWPCQTVTLAHMNSESEAWYQSAADLCLKQVFAECGVNMETAQCLLYMSLYLQGTHSSMKTVFMHGIAVKVAYQLGLHSAESSKGADPVDSELRKRIWFGLVLLDRTLCMTVGRPAVIQDAYSTHEWPQTCLDSAGKHIVENDELTIPYLRATLTLYQILQRTVDVLFGSNCGTKPSFSLDLLAKIYNLEADLEQWKQGLPHHLCIIEANRLSAVQMTDDDRATKLRRTKTIVTLRYLSSRILIHRPILEGLLEITIAADAKPDHYQAMRQAGINPIRLEVSCAARLIDIINSLVTGSIEGHQSLGAWWFSLFYVFNAALAILGSLLVSQPKWQCPEMLSNTDRQAARQALQQSLQVLDSLDMGHSTVARCRAYLQELINIAEPELLASDRESQNQAPLRGDHAGGLNVQPHGATNRNTVPHAIFPEPFQQFASDVNLDNFLFPLDIQTFGGLPIGFDQPFI